MNVRFGRRWLAFGALAALAATGAAGPLSQAIVARRPIFPGQHWSWKAPEEAGFSMHALQDFSRRVGGIGCVVHGGEMIPDFAFE